MGESLGELIDRLYEARVARLKLEKQVEEKRAEEVAQRTAIVARLEEQGLEKGSGTEATASITRKTVPRLVDFDAFTRWVRETGAVDLLWRRVNPTAFRECLEQGTFVPGVEAALDVDLSLVRSHR